MTYEEAQRVFEWCRENELRRPEICRHAPGYYHLRWTFGFDAQVVTTDNLQSARYWCAFMRNEHASGELGYKETEKREIRHDQGPLFDES